MTPIKRLIFYFSFQAKRLIFFIFLLKSNNSFCPIFLFKPNGFFFSFIFSFQTKRFSYFFFLSQATPFNEFNKKTISTDTQTIFFDTVAILSMHNFSQTQYPLLWHPPFRLFNNDASHYFATLNKHLQKNRFHSLEDKIELSFGASSCENMMEINIICKYILIN